MINLLLCGNEKVFDGALTELISITNRTEESINCFVFTAELTRIKPEYTSIKDEQIEFLEEVVKRKNPAIKEGLDSQEFEFMKTTPLFEEYSLALKDELVKKIVDCADSIDVLYYIFLYLKKKSYTHSLELTFHI